MNEKLVSLAIQQYHFYFRDKSTSLSALRPATSSLGLTYSWNVTNQHRRLSSRFGVVFFQTPKMLNSRSTGLSRLLTTRSLLRLEVLCYSNFWYHSYRPSSQCTEFFTLWNMLLLLHLHLKHVAKNKTKKPHLMLLIRFTNSPTFTLAELIPGPSYIGQMVMFNTVFAPSYPG